jgi:homocysteine S-methyltransferase
MAALERTLADGRVVVLDGATGTELERLGAAMDDAAWCALATLSDPDLLRQVHRSYIDAGANVITTNTYASCRHMLEAAGQGDQVASILRQTVRLAREARDAAAPDRPVAIAGAISHMHPHVIGGDGEDLARRPTETQQAANYREMAELLAEAGVDLILLEMMSDPDRARHIVPAALATGLPVWVGFTCKTDARGKLVAYRRPDLDFGEMVESVMALGGSVAGVMHSTVDDTTAALKVLPAHWTGPIMAYPESGTFEMPHWQFVDVIPPKDFAQQCLTWVEGGVQIIGGCCGITIDHIACMTAALRAR